jgi:hypothetical protein
MICYVGLDGSTKETAICVVGETGDRYGMVSREQTRMPLRPYWRGGQRVREDWHREQAR